MQIQGIACLHPRCPKQKWEVWPFSNQSKQFWRALVDRKRPVVVRLSYSLQLIFVHEFCKTTEWKMPFIFARILQNNRVENTVLADKRNLLLTTMVKDYTVSL